MREEVCADDAREPEASPPDSENLRSDSVVAEGASANGPVLRDLGAAVALWAQKIEDYMRLLNERINEVMAVDKLFGSVVGQSFVQAMLDNGIKLSMCCLLWTMCEECCPTCAPTSRIATRCPNMNSCG